MNFRTPLFAGCALLALAAAAPAFAQDPASQPPGEDTTLVDEIIVTTERRSQSLQDVPVAITAIDSETRDNAGILTIQDMAQFTPGLSYNTSTDRPSIRGIARQSNTFSLDSPVANYFDGIYTSSVQDASRRPIFIERTEVLRGPQGALSGRGSIAGAINTISKRPDDEFGGAVGLMTSDHQRYGFEATVTGPVTDWLRGRANFGRYRQDEGFFTNVANGTTEGDQPNNRQIQDYLLEADVGEDVDVFLKAAFADYDETRRSGGGFAPYQSGNDPCTPNAFGGGLVPSASYGFFRPGVGCNTTGAFNNQATQIGTQTTNPATPGNLRVFNNDYRSRQKLDDHHVYLADVTWHAPWADLRYIGGHQNYVYTQLTDADDTPITSFILPTALNRRVSPGGVNMYQEEREWFSHEVTLTSTNDGPLQWIGGLYQSFEDFNQQPSTQWFAGYDELNNPLSEVTFSSAGVAPNADPYRAQYGHLFGTTRSTAAFGQVDYKVNDQWKVTLGARYNVDEKAVLEQSRLIYNNTATLAGGLAFGAPRALDITGTQAPGYALVNPATAVVPPGYRLLDSTQFPLNAAGTRRVLPDGSTIPLTGAGSAVLLAPGVVAPTTIDAEGNRVRELEGDWSALTGSVGVDYTPNDDTLIYARFARGYRPGGFNAGFITATPQADAEFVNSYELGAKLTLNGSLRLNTAVYMYDYTDIQLPLATFERCIIPGDFSTCTAVNSFVNLPSARNQGVEVEGLWMPTNNFQMIFSYGYLDAQIKNGKTLNGFENPLDPSAILSTAQRFLPINCGPNPNPAPTATCDAQGRALDSITLQQRYTQELSGNPLANSPKHKIAINGNYTFRDLFDAGDLTVSASYIWRDDALSNLFNVTQDRTPSYDQVNLRAVFRTTDDQWQVIGFVQNVFDEDVVENGGITRRASGPIGAPGTTQIYYDTFDLAPPRSIGVEVQRRF